MRILPALVWTAALCAVARGDAGLPPRGEPGLVPFSLLDERADPPSASVGMLDLLTGQILWQEVVPSRELPWQRWNGLEVMATLTPDKNRHRTVFRHSGTGRVRLEIDGQVSPISRAGGPRILVSTGEKETRAFDERTGALLWSRPGSGWGTSVVRPSRTLMILQERPRRVALDVASGTEAWARPSDEMEHVAAAAGRVFRYGHQHPRILEFNAETGEDGRALDLPSGLVSLSALSSRLLVCLSDRVLSVRPEDLSIEWTWPSASRATSVWGHGSTIVVDAEKNQKILLDASTGRQTGRLSVPEHTGTSSSLSGPGLFVFEVRGHREGPALRILNTATGATLWEGDDARAYTGGIPGLLLLRRRSELCRLETDDGRVRWTFPLPGAILDACLRRDRAVFLFERQALAVDPSTGSVLWRTDLPCRATKAGFGWFSRE